MHSTASDGSATPQQLVDEAVYKNIDIIALTDYNVVDNIDEIKAYGGDSWIIRTAFLNYPDSVLVTPGQSS